MLPELPAPEELVFPPVLPEPLPSGTSGSGVVVPGSVEVPGLVGSSGVGSVVPGLSGSTDGSVGSLGTVGSTGSAGFVVSQEQFPEVY